jgi:iron complex outermembrane receptor protein
MNIRKKTVLALSVQVALGSSLVFAQEADNEQETEAGKLEVISVTAQKRTQSIQDVPISITTLNGERFDSLFSGGGDILELATRVPGLYAESSNGRVAPRFYIRGLGNTDFDLAASQPVSIIIDDVVKENVILKSFPLFDVGQVEVLRGAQGTLFGRNTTAGIVKFDSNKPTEDFEAYTKVAFGSLGTRNFEGAVGGGLGGDFSGRFSFLSQNRSDFIDNGFTGEDDALGGFQELAWRAQLAYNPNDDFNALLSVQNRNLDGTSSVFRANVLTTGQQGLNSNFDRDRVFFDQGDNNPQKYINTGVSLKLEYTLANGNTLTSITANESISGRSLGDIDGGAIVNTPNVDINGDGIPDPSIDTNGDGIPDQTSFPGVIPFGAVTEDQLDNFNQFTQEIRLASSDDTDLTWQVGAFFFDSEFDVTTIDGFFGATTVFHENTTWAVFGQTSYDINDKLDITAGLRYTDDEKSLRVGDQNVDGFALVIGLASIQDIAPIDVDDGQVSGELSLNYKLDDNTSLYARYSNGFRAQTIQGRDVAFEGFPSVAESETINSIEAGFKADLLDDTLRINGAVYAYQIDDIQLSAIGGDGNNTALINADQANGQGVEFDLQWLASEYLTFTAGFSYNDTEIDDPDLRVAVCGSGQCTPTDTLENGLAIVDGNPLPQAPETIFNFTARYSIPTDSGEFYAFTDWAFQGETNIFLYESVEFTTDDNFEGGLRLGYKNFDHEYEIALFARNITDEENLRAAIDFNNLTGIVNQPRVVGIEFRKDFF